MGITKKILFPTDFSQVAENAFLYALSLAEQTKAEIKVIHVVPVFEPEDKNVQIHPFMKTANLELERSELKNFEKEQERLKQVVTALNKEHLHLEYVFLKGNLQDVIFDLAESQRIDMIIIGTSGANTIDKKLFGSNTINIINNVDIPVMAIPAKAKFTSISNYSTAVMLEPGELSAIRKIAGYLSIMGLPMNCVSVVSSTKETAFCEEKKQKWLKDVNCPNVTVDIVFNEDIDRGLMEYTRDNEIDLLGILHRKLPMAKRFFTTNHSKLLLKYSGIALLVYNI